MSCECIPSLFRVWLVLLICEEVHLIKLTSSHGLLSYLFQSALTIYHFPCFSIMVVMRNSFGVVIGWWIKYTDLSEFLKYVVVVLMKFYWINSCYNIIHHSISVIFWNNMCEMYINQVIIPNTLFQSSM